MKSWALIVEYVRERREGSGDAKFAAALQGVEQLAGFIANSSLRHELFGWTSMCDLCIQQTEHAPPSVAHLRISPQASGLIEFRYFDTAVEHRQWTRTETPERAVERLRSFLRQLHWISGPVTTLFESNVDEPRT